MFVLVIPGSGVLILPGYGFGTQHRAPPSCLPEAEHRGTGNGCVQAHGSSCGRLATSSSRLFPTRTYLPSPQRQRTGSRDGGTVTGVCCGLRHRVSSWSRGSVPAERGEPAVAPRSVLALLLPHNI